jgi:hypothetical protein
MLPLGTDIDLLLHHPIIILTRHNIITKSTFRKGGAKIETK